MSSSRRNIVLILCDTLRPDFLHAYGAEPFIPTPNIDALAQNGAVFDNAVTASTVCGPSRACMATGCAVSGHDSWTNNIPPRAGMEFFPERLDRAGYMTAAVGCYDHAPFGASIGYQYLYRFDENRPDSEYLAYLQSKYPECRSAYEHADGDSLHFKYPEEDHYERWSCDRATDFIRSYTKTGEVPDKNHLTGNGEAKPGAPFFLYLGFLSPHAPYLPPKEMSGRVIPAALPAIRTTKRDLDMPAVERNRRAFLNPPNALTDPESVFPARQRERLAYCEMICEVDDLVGRVVDCLKECGVYENTTILFSSDHGSMENDYNMSTKGPYPYSPQLFVPLIMSNHPGLRGHKDCLCGLIDVGATVLSIAGDEKKFGVSRSLHGMADGSVPERQTIMSEFCDSCKTIVDKRYTFTYYPFTGVTTLYDRGTDPEMDHNLGGKPEYAALEHRYLTEVIDWLLLAKGVRIEAHDLVTDVKNGIEEKDPKFLETFDIAYPLSDWASVERIRAAGLDPDINEFCRDYPIKAHYGVYFHKPKPEK